MLTLTIATLTIAYIFVAFVLPVAAVAASVYWGYAYVQSGGTIFGAIIVSLLSAFVLLLVLSFLKRSLKRAMNKVDLDELEDVDTPESD